MVAIGATCMILGEQDALMAIETRLWRMDRQSVNEACVRASANVKHACKEGLAGKLMVPGPSSWAARAMMSRSPLGADQKIGPGVHWRAAVASDEATQRHKIRHSTSAVHCHIKPRKISILPVQSMPGQHGYMRASQTLHGISHLRLCLSLLEVAVDMGDDPAAYDARQLDSA